MINKNCIICLSASNIFITCMNCDNITCFTCIKKYKLECANCNVMYLDYDIKKIPFKKIFSTYKLNYLQHKIKTKDRNQISQYNIKHKNKQLLRFGTQISYNTDKLNLCSANFMCFCPNNDCLGIIKKQYNKCILCKTQVCDKCHETKFTDHICDPIILNSIEEKLLNCKPCPRCFNYIIKYEGCNDMICTQCKCRFNWRTLTIDIKNSNHHYDKIIPNTNIERAFNIKNNTIYGFYNYIVIPFLNNINGYIYNIECEYIIQKNNNSNKIINKLYKLYKKKDYMQYLYNNLNNNISLSEFKILLNKYLDINIIPKSLIYDVINNNIILISKKRKEILIKTNLVSNNNNSIQLLDDNQQNHADNIINILSKYRTVLDTSMPGSGKTFISLHCIKQLHIKHLLVLCPPSLVGKWNKIITLYNGYNQFEFYVISYSKLHVNDNSPNNDLFIQNIIYYTTQKKYNFKLTSKIKKFLKYNAAIIVDEGHVIRNNGKTLFAISLLCQYTYRHNGLILNLTATPIEKPSQIRNIIKKMGIHYDNNSSFLKDFIIFIINIIDNNEIKKYFDNNIDKIKIKNSVRKYANQIFDICLIKNIESNYITDILHNFIKLNITVFFNILMDKINYSSLPYINDFPIYKVDYYLTDVQKKMLATAFTNIDTCNSTNFIQCNSLISKGLVQVETALIPSIWNIVKYIISNTKNCKVIIAINYNESINDIKKLNKEYNILLINGNVKNKDKIIELFQESNNNNRILLINPSSINVGIDLDDKHGDYRRFVIFNPNFISINMYQFMYRFMRRDSKSTPIIHVINSHKIIIENLKNKNISFNNKITLIDSFKYWKENQTNLEKLINKINYNN
ncbi:putative NTPase/helicase [Alphaentomopoxvirus acuprea]|uniref:Putative NTPase/helicase n=1 Tax=Alphaentomopoxvirus acuprea TaxID=62099 RepID=W6JLM5_9POXV|nr:putative NTPase/helicase [Anomala cuprea entomopoxvirus]BAO49546.1 putative NTPase/helicase [Anomala cuprea entomopoxvirus]